MCSGNRSAKPHRLREVLAREGLERILVSTDHGQMVDTTCFDCDYYIWLDEGRDLPLRNARHPSCST